MHWIRERAEEVEDCPEGELAAHRGGVFHPGVPFAGVQEGVVGGGVEGGEGVGVGGFDGGGGGGGEEEVG